MEGGKGKWGRGEAMPIMLVSAGRARMHRGALLHRRRRRRGRAAEVKFPFLAFDLEWEKLPIICNATGASVTLQNPSPVRNGQSGMPRRSAPPLHRRRHRHEATTDGRCRGKVELTGKVAHMSHASHAVRFESLRMRSLARSSHATEQSASVAPVGVGGWVALGSVGTQM